jgi:hypothetical protein
MGTLSNMLAYIGHVTLVVYLYIIPFLALDILHGCLASLHLGEVEIQESSDPHLCVSAKTSFNPSIGKCVPKVTPSS